MGSFFLTTGTILFFAGLACLLIVFTSVTRRLKINKQLPAQFRPRPSYKESILSLIGILAIVLSQGCYWFNSRVTTFIPFDETVPRLKLSFLYEEYRTPRLVMQSSDQSHQIISQIVPFNNDKLVIGVEVVRWKKFFNSLGIKDCYRVNGVFYQTDKPLPPPTLDLLPDHNLNGGPSELGSLATWMGSYFPGKMQLLFSPVIQSGDQYQYVVDIAPDTVTAEQAEILKTSSLPQSDSKAKRKPR